MNFLKKFKKEEKRVNYYVNIYKNKNEELIFNTTAINNIGAAISTNEIEVIKKPYDNNIIGHKLLEFFDLCQKDPYMKDSIASNLFEQLGIKNRSKFSKEYLGITAIKNFKEGIYDIRPSKRDGSTYLDLLDFRIVIGLGASSIELGESVINAFEKCK